MGSECHIVVSGGPEGLAEEGRRRIVELEGLWSRFLPDSEISLLNSMSGEPVPVSDDTLALVSRAVEAWRFTGGAYDPTVLGAMLRAGYDRSFELLGKNVHSGTSDLVVACTDIEIDDNLVTLPAGTGFDPGGIGKGLAADRVVEELTAAGATGVCVNMGGDVRVMGAGPDGEGWTVALEHPWIEQPLVLLGIGNGAVATSTTLKRHWTVDGQNRHHIIDPRTGAPAVTDIDLVSVVAGNAWTAEVLAKAVLIRGAEHPFDLIDGSGAEALAVTHEGTVVVSDGFAGFCDGADIPVAVRQVLPVEPDQDSDPPL